MRARGRPASRSLPLALFLIAFILLQAAPAWAQCVGCTFERSPAEGPPGTVISVSGAGCIEYGKPYETATVRLARRASPDEAPFDSSKNYQVQPDGTWGGDFKVPQEAPPDDYKIQATCQASDMVFYIGDFDFKVTDLSSPSPQPSSPSPTKPSRMPKPSPSPSLSPVAPPSPTEEAAAVATPSPSPTVLVKANKGSQRGQPALLLPLIFVLLVSGGGLVVWKFRRR